MTARVTATVTKSKRGWRLNMKTIGQAVEELGIEKDVIIAIDYRLILKNTAGNHNYMPKRQVHVVRISGYLPQSSVSDTLWHELAHCMQAERHAIANDCPIEDFDRVYGNANDNYHLNQYEIEARKIALQNKNTGRKLVRN